jgi:parallel beta-helix repeat protein
MQTRLKATTLTTLAMASVVTALPVGTASATHVQCGDTVTASTTLDSDLVNCPPPRAIGIAGRGITLDLGGHTVDGTGAGFGIRSGLGGSSAAEITVLNGLVREFATGVELSFGPDQAVRDVLVTGNQAGVRLTHGTRLAAEGVTAAGNVIGINLTNLIEPVVTDNDVFANAAGMGGGALIANGTFARNRVHDNEFGGIGFVGMFGSRVVGNHSSRNGLYGILLDDSSFRNVVESNHAERNGSDGILIEGGEDTALTGNRTDRNGDDGIDVDWPGVTLTRNHAFFNGDLGIDAVPGTIDGGKNKARHNGNPAQCTGVACN